MWHIIYATFLREYSQNPRNITATSYKFPLACKSGNTPNLAAVCLTKIAQLRLQGWQRWFLRRPDVPPFDRLFLSRNESITRCYSLICTE